MSATAEIKTVHGSQRKIRMTIKELTILRQPVYDIQVKRVAIFWFVALIKTDKPCIRKLPKA